jgi:TetR/AcrR family transcriptional repressor of nem operon
MKHSREDILQGGVELFRKYGYEGTGVQQILTSLNIPKGSFYNYFKSKEDFVLESIKLYGAMGFDNHRQALSNNSLSPLNRIKKHVEDVQKQYVVESFEKSCLLDMLAIEVCGSNKKIAKTIDGIFEKRKQIYANCIKEGQELGEIRKDESAEDLAEFLLSGFSGAQLKAKTEKSIRPMKIFIHQYFSYIQQ